MSQKDKQNPLKQRHLVVGTYNKSVLYCCIGYIGPFQW